MKSAYELALERMEQKGIEPPREDALDETTRAAIAEARSKAEAQLAQLDILRQGGASGDPAAAGQESERYRIDRERIEAERDRAIAALRDQARG